LDIKAFLKTLSFDTIESAFKWHIVDRFFSPFERLKLKNRNFSIIGNNCVTGGMYHKFGLQFSSPTIWSFFFPDEYLKFLENLNWYLKQPLKFTQETRHPMAQRLRETVYPNYPIGLLGGDVEIHFMHYKSEQEASDKWSRRAKRVNFNNLFVVFSDAEEEFKEEFAERFDKLPFKHKIFFSCKPRNNCKCTVFIQDYSDATHVFDSTKNRKYEKYIDLVKWLNGEKYFLKKRQLGHHDVH
jgi:uncharacterized protein (DUF1919 family)